MTEGRRAALGAAVLFVLNAWVCRELFGLEYSQFMESIEASYISLARYISEHPFEWGWFPLWYQGIPFQNTYPPVLHQMTGMAAWATALSPASAYHFVCAVMYCLGPVTLFWLGYRLSGSFWPAWLAGLLHSLTSPSAWLLADVADDIGGPLNARRYQTLMFYGEGPHVTSLTLLPLAVVALAWALRERRVVPTYAAALALAAVPLTNWLGAVGLACAAFCCLLTREDRRRPLPWAWAAGVGALAYLLAAAWIPPSTISDVRRNAQSVGGPYPLEVQNVWYWLLIFAVLALFDWAMVRAKAGPAMRFGLYYAHLAGGPVAVREIFGPAIIPQPERYHLEMEQGLCILLAFALWAALMRVPRPAAALAAAAVAAGLVYEAAVVRRHARELTQGIDVTETPEYRLAEQAGELGPEARVWAEGSAGFWLNAFAPNPQLHGGFDQGTTNPLIPAITYGIQDNEDAGAENLAWMQAFGVDGLLIGGYDSALGQSAVKDEAKFAGYFQPVWSDGDLAVWRTPRRSQSIARVLFADERVSRTPAHALDVAPVEDLIAAIEAPERPLPATAWLSSDHLRVTAPNLTPDQWLLVQISHDPGWKATVNGRSVPVERSRLGMVLVEPRCEGDCVVELGYDGGPEAFAARAGLFSAVAAGLVWFRRERGNGAIPARR